MYEVDGIEPSRSLDGHEVSLETAVHCLRLIEYYAGEAFQVKAWHDYDKGGRFTSRMQVAGSGALQRSAEDKFENIFSPCSEWCAIRPAGRTLGLATLAFAILSSVHCSLEMMVFVVTRAFPFVLFRLLDEPVVAFALWLLSQPGCMLDIFSAAFLADINTVVLLLSADAIAILTMLRREICRI